MKEILQQKQFLHPSVGSVLSIPSLCRRQTSSLAAVFHMIAFFTGNSMFWLELCVPSAGLVPPPRLTGVTRAVRPQGPHARGLWGWMAPAPMQVGKGLPTPGSGSWPAQRGVSPPWGAPLQNRRSWGAGCEEEAWVPRWESSQDPAAVQGAAPRYPLAGEHWASGPPP